MNLDWNKQQRDLYDRMLQFAATVCGSDLVQRDRNGVFNRRGWDLCGEYGVQGFPIPEQYGGQGYDALTTAYLLEGFGYGNRDNGLSMAIGAHLWGCTIPLLHWGTEQQRTAYLPRLASGEWIGALCITEQQAGSDVAGMQTVATKQKNTYILDGHKCYITNSSIANLFIVLAKTNPDAGILGLTAFLVEADRPGLDVSLSVDKMGLQTVPMGEVTLHGCRVPVENRLGREGSGFALFNLAMEWERSFILAPAVGSMARLLDSSVQYARQRQQFGQPIGNFQLIASKLVDMRLRLESARSMLYKVGWLKSTEQPAALEASMAKLHISQAWVQTCHDALGLHGGYGYLTSSEIERDLRDAVGSQIYSGTSEIQRLAIARLMNLT